MVYIEAAGKPFELGFEHGRQAAPLIHGFVDYLVRTSGRPKEVVLAATHAFLPEFAEYCPALVEEIRGLAEGAQITFEEALLLQIRAQIIPVLPSEGCTSFAVSGDHTADGGILLGQTSDMVPELQPFFIVVRLRPEGQPALLTWTFAGQLGYHGLNEHGVAHFANDVYAGAPPPGSGRRGLPHYPIKRRLYECRTRAEVLAMWERFPVCSSGNYMCAAGDPAIFDLEVTPAGFAEFTNGGTGWLGHANHFTTGRFRTSETDAAALPDSFPRQGRIESLLSELTARGNVTVEDLKAVVADHRGHPTSICRHDTDAPSGMKTAAGLIAEPQSGRLHVSDGNPCEGRWHEFLLN